MRRKLAALLALITPLPSLHALCSYKGKMYAKTTMSEEYRDSKWVVRVRVLATDNHWSDIDESWSLYSLEVMKSYKGDPPPRITMFTYRDSGGFYLDKGMVNDLGGEYLLFLTPLARVEGGPPAAKDSTEVNYACGQSKEWTKVTTMEEKRLLSLSRER